MFRLLFIFTLVLILPQQSRSLDLSLKDAKLMALENNRDIQIEEKNIEFSRGEVIKQKGAFDPLFNLSSSYTDSKIPTASSFIASGTVNQEDFNIGSSILGNLTTGTFYELYNFSLTRTKTDSPIETLSPVLFSSLSFSIGQELLRNFGREINETPIIAAKQNVDISVNEFESTVSDVLFNVERDYWLLVAAVQNLELEKKGLELAIDLQNRNQVQVDVGVLPQVAVTQAKSEVAAREVDVISAENLLELAEDRLKNRLVIPFETEINLVNEPKKPEILLNEEISLDTAYNKRPELKLVQNEIERSKAFVKFYSNQRLPRFAIEGVLQFQGLGGDENENRLIFTEELVPIQEKFDSQSDSFQNLFGADFPTWTILGVLSFPIFNRTAKGEYIKSRAELDKKTIEYKRAKEQIALEVRDAIRELRNSLRRIEAATVSVELAKEVVGNEGEKFKVGLSTTRDVLEAQRDLIDAQTQQLRAITDYNIALAKLEQAQGTILESSGVIIEDGGLMVDKIRYQ